MDSKFYGIVYQNKQLQKEMDDFYETVSYVLNGENHAKYFGQLLKMILDNPNSYLYRQFVETQLAENNYQKLMSGKTKIETLTQAKSIRNQRINNFSDMLLEESLQDNSNTIDINIDVKFDIEKIDDVNKKILGYLQSKGFSQKDTLWCANQFKDILVKYVDLDQKNEETKKAMRPQLDKKLDDTKRNVTESIIYNNKVTDKENAESYTELLFSACNNELDKSYIKNRLTKEYFLEKIVKDFCTELYLNSPQLNNENLDQLFQYSLEHNYITQSQANIFKQKITPSSDMYK